jgi:hypothetical protein
MSVLASVGRWSAVAVATGLLWASGPASVDEGQPPALPSAVSPELISPELMEDARRKLSTGLSERARKEGEEDRPDMADPAAGSSAPRPAAAAPIREAPSGAPDGRQEAGPVDVSVPLPPPVPALPAQADAPPAAAAATFDAASGAGEAQGERVGAAPAPDGTPCCAAPEPRRLHVWALTRGLPRIGEPSRRRGSPRTGEWRGAPAGSGRCVRFSFGSSAGGLALPRGKLPERRWAPSPAAQWPARGAG